MFFLSFSGNICIYKKVAVLKLLKKMTVKKEMYQILAIGFIEKMFS